MRYIQTWETARREQNVLRYKLKMDQLEKTLNNYYVREKNENHVNSELTRYLTWRIAVSAIFCQFFFLLIYIKKVLDSLYTKVFKVLKGSVIKIKADGDIQ